MSQTERYSPIEAAEHIALGELEKFSWVYQFIVAMMQHGIDSFKPRNASLLDFGCGWGFHLSQLKNTRPSLEYVGYEPYMTRDQVDKTIPVFKKLDNIASSSFGFITAIDVIEHIEDDLDALKQCHRLLADDGILMIKVPAYMHLWTSSDLVSGHFRRYTKKNITNVVRKASFKIIDAFYIFSSIYPVVLFRKGAMKILEMAGEKNASSSFHKLCPKDPLGIPSMLTKLELAMIRKTRLRFPFGSGVFLYAKKKH